MEAASTIDDEFLIEFVAGSLPAAEAFPTAARPLMRRFARSAAPDLPPDLRDEVVSQSLEYLIEHGKQFQPARGTAKAFLKLMTGQAARKVRADYCPPGCRTRPTRDERCRPPKAVPLCSIDVESPTGVAEVETACEVRGILRRAPEKIARALVLIYLAGETLAAAARDVGMSRFALSREIARFMRTVRDAGAA